MGEAGSPCALVEIILDSLNSALESQGPVTCTGASLQYVARLYRSSTVTHMKYSPGVTVLVSQRKFSPLGGSGEYERKTRGRKTLNRSSDEGVAVAGGGLPY